MSVANIISSALGGGILGTVGSVISKWLDTKKDIDMIKLQHQHEERMLMHEQSMARLQLETQKSLAAIDANAKISVADLAALETSLQEDKAAYVTASPKLLIVDLIRGLMRPTITGSLVGFCMWVVGYAFIERLVNFNDPLIMAQVVAVLEGLSCSMTLATSWWFGSRGHTAKRAG